MLSRKWVCGGMSKILLVDDEPNILEITKMVLEKEGYEVFTTEYGKETFEKINQYNPDLIILDIMMPDASGWQVCKEIKEKNETKDIPVAMFSVRTSAGSVKKSYEYAHADAHIKKPFTMEELLGTVKSLLQK
jgi:DNA-binding response OmpR family regulator